MYIYSSALFVKLFKETTRGPSIYLSLLKGTIAKEDNTTQVSSKNSYKKK